MSLKDTSGSPVPTGVQTVDVAMWWAFARNATGESPRVELGGSFTIANDDWLSIHGDFHAVIPCGEDDYASANARISLDKNGVKIEYQAIGMDLYCAAAAKGQGLTLVHFSAQLKRFLRDRGVHLGFVLGVFRTCHGVSGGH